MYVTLLEASLSQALTCLAMSSSVTRDASTCVRVYSVSTSTFETIYVSNDYAIDRQCHFLATQ